MLKLNWTNLLAELQKLGTDAPQVLASLQAMLTKLDTEAATVMSFLTKYFPQLATLEPTLVTEAKDVINFLLIWEPKVLPYVLQALTLVASLLPAA